MRSFRSSLIRLVRTPVKTALFFLLLSFTIQVYCINSIKGIIRI